MLKFIHAADFHLDSAFHALPPRQAAARRQESRELLFLLAEEVNRRGIQLVLLAGDLFDSARIFRETGEQLAEAFDRMQAQVVIAPGNHDWYGRDTVWQEVSWPDNVHIFTENHMEELDFPEWNLAIHGAAFTDSEQAESLLSGFSAPQDGRVHFGLLHGEIDSSESRYNPIRREEIQASGLTYLALGHIHKRMEPRNIGSTLCAWPGCPEGHGFDETGLKGVLEGTLENGQVQLRFLPLPGRRYELFPVNVTGRTLRTALKESLPKETERDIFRITLTGETKEPVDCEALREKLAPHFYSLEIRDETCLAGDIWQRSGEDSLRGLFLQNLRQQWKSAETEEDRNRITRAVRFGLAALDHRDLE